MRINLNIYCKIKNVFSLKLFKSVLLINDISYLFYY